MKIPLKPNSTEPRYLVNLNTSSNYKNKYITCETDNSRSKNFYQKKFKFKLIGKKIRFPISMDIMAKRF